MPRCLLKGLWLLLKARDYARACERPIWDFAVEGPELLAAGLTSADLRWLICQDYVEHGVETTKPGMATRVFERPKSLAFPEMTCFVLTDKGRAFTIGFGAKGLGNPPPGPEGNELPANDLVALPIPSWNADLRELCLDGRLVKRFHRPAPNQEVILAAFEEDGWPPRIDNPIPPRAGTADAGERLHHAIIRLNRGRLYPALRFRSVGAGEGVCWERADGGGTGSTPDRHRIDT